MARPVKLEEGSSPFPVPKPEQELTQEELSLIKRAQAIAATIDGSLPINGAPIQGAEELSPKEGIALKITATVAPILFPHVALFAVEVGLKKEQLYRKELLKASEEASQIQQNIEKMIDLSGKFAIHANDKDELTLSDEIKALCKDLKEKGIEILQGDEKKINRERMAELKSHISSHIDRLKTELQKKFTTEIQVKINELSSLLECLKTIEKYSNRLNSSIVGNQRK